MLRFLAQVPVDTTSLPKVNLNQGTPLIGDIMTIFFSILGAICLVVITLAGFRYVISRGEPQTIAKAKNTILYALIGLGISIFAISIVNFVTKRLT